MQITNGNFLIYRTNFFATRIVENYLEPVEFEMEVGFQFGPGEALPANEPDNEQTIAYNKLEFFVDYVMNKSIFVNQHNVFWYEMAGLETTNNYVVFHQDPYDDLITKYLYYKMQAITFPAFLIVDIAIWSSSTKLKFNFIGEETVSLPGIEDTIGELSYHSQPWYFRNDCDTRDYTPEDEKELDNPPESSVNFDVILELLQHGSGMPGEILDIKKFRPTIV